jgi:hypothetical protein
LALIEPIVTSLLREAKDPLAEDSNRFANQFIALVGSGNTEAAWQHFFDGRGTPGRWAAMSEKSKRDSRGSQSERSPAFELTLTFVKRLRIAAASQCQQQS